MSAPGAARLVLKKKSIIARGDIWNIKKKNEMRGGVKGEGGRNGGGFGEVIAPPLREGLKKSMELSGGGQSFTLGRGRGDTAIGKSFPPCEVSPPYYSTPSLDQIPP